MTCGAVVGLLLLGACATGQGSSDAGAHSDAAPLADSGPSIDGAADEIDGAPGGGGSAVLNEFVASHTGTDDCEFVEVLGDASADLGDYTVLAVEGDAGAAGTIGAVSHMVEVGTTSAGGLWVSPFLSGALENGTATFLLVRGYTGGGGDLDADDDGDLDDGPWDELADAVAVTDGGASDVVYGGATLLAADFDGGSLTVGGASRIPSGTDTGSDGDWVRNDFDGDGLTCGTMAAAPGEAINTPGAVNAVKQ